MLNGLDLFSGIGGLGLALDPWVRPVAYCEIDRYCHAVLLSRMRQRKLRSAPIWDDITTLRATMLPRHGGIDIVYGGFPCQDISSAGRGAGLVGERSGLFWQIERLVKETNPRFVFLENVSAIRTRGLNAVVQSFTELGYDCRWTVVSAAEVGAPHLRKRWFLLAKAPNAAAMQRPSIERNEPNRDNERTENVADPAGECERESSNEADAESIGRQTRDESFDGGSNVPDAFSERTQDGVRASSPESENAKLDHANWWAVEPNVGRVAHGVPFRVDRLRGLGNAVVPAQAREAFERLSGMKGPSQ